MVCVLSSWMDINHSSLLCVCVAPRPVQLPVQALAPLAAHHQADFTDPVPLPPLPACALAHRWRRRPSLRR
jgi:hypothetical protein